MRCVVLDDYQGVALAMADWTVLDGRVETETTREPIADPASLVTALAGAEIVVAMRERTRFDRALLEALPDLKLLVTTGMRNAAIDLAAAAARGVTVSGTAGTSGATAELAWGWHSCATFQRSTERCARAAAGRRPSGSGSRG